MVVLVFDTVMDQRGFMNRITSFDRCTLRLNHVRPVLFLLYKNEWLLIKHFYRQSTYSLNIVSFAYISI